MSIEIKSPPHDLNAEERIIASVLVSSEEVEHLVGSLGCDNFYDSFLRDTWDAIKALHLDGEPIDIITMTEVMSKSGHDGEQVSGRLCRIVGELPPIPFPTNELVARLQLATYKRAILRVGTHLINLAWGINDE